MQLNSLSMYIVTSAELDLRPREVEAVLLTSNSLLAHIMVRHICHDVCVCMSTTCMCILSASVCVCVFGCVSLATVFCTALVLGFNLSDSAHIHDTRH